MKLVKENHSHLNAFYIFLSPPSLSELESRLKGRGSETEASIQSRLDASKAEVTYARQANVYDIVIVNDDVDRAYKKLEAVAVRDEKVESDLLPKDLHA